MPPSRSIVLFTLYPQGAPYIAEACRFSEARDIPLTIVLSAKPPKTAPPAMQRVKQGARRLITRHRLARPGRRVRFCRDVNAARALDLERGAHGLVGCFDQIFKAPAIAGFASLANIHPSILPYFRGPNPLYWCFMRGERQTGFTLHTITPKIDEGPIVHQELVSLAGCADPAAVEQTVLTAAARIVFPYLDHVVCGAPWARRRVDASAVYAHPIDYAPHPPAARAA